jgi:hypothetical protein
MRRSLPYNASDWYNYYWLYDVKEIAGAKTVWNARPYTYGIWDLPYVNDPRIIGGTVDVDGGILYVAIDLHDRPPLILSFKLPA